MAYLQCSLLRSHFYEADQITWDITWGQVFCAIFKGEDCNKAR